MCTWLRYFCSVTYFLDLRQQAPTRLLLLVTIDWLVGSLLMQFSQKTALRISDFLNEVRGLQR